MKTFIDSDFLLKNNVARRLYHEYAASMPIFDFHCHLPVDQISSNGNFSNISRIWLEGDHYKWRAMRANGIPEDYITGEAEDLEKFRAWAKTVPYTIGNPLYHWTHLELKRYFNREELLDPQSADRIYDAASSILADSDFRPIGILNRSRVKFICTTDDPLDNLEHHIAIEKKSALETKVLPTFRPDKALDFNNPRSFNHYLNNLESVSNTAIINYTDYLEALKSRHDFFHNCGCRLSDHALLQAIYREAGANELNTAFNLIRSGKNLYKKQIVALKTAVLKEIAIMNAKRGWTMQLHIGALRNTNLRMFKILGPDSGFDSISDGEIAGPLSAFLDSLNSHGQLPKLIIYALNPAYYSIIASLCGNFQEAPIPGKIQFGSAWWYNDQKNGMEDQMTVLANLGLLSRFVGMLTDSRSFLSFPRHEYFRRILCNLIGTWVEDGEAPADYTLLGKMVQDISYNNAIRYFGID